MESNPIKILVIVGPTTSGKSDLAVKLAKRFNGEIISADSRQVYKGLDIGTGKITKKEMEGIRHHLLDVADPKMRFTVIDFKRLAERAIDDVARRGKLPIICGGTGFYIDAVVNQRDFPIVKEDKKLRTKLSKKSAEQLLAMLVKLDPKRAKAMAASNSERHNRRRLVRAIEIATAINSTFNSTNDSAFNWATKMEGRAIAIRSAERPTNGNSTDMVRCARRLSRSNYDPIWIGIKVPPEKLRERIHKRLLKRLKSGMIAEAERLHTKGLSWKRMNELGLEYRYMAELLQGKLTRRQFMDALENKIWQYARRQLTWWRRNRSIRWFASVSNLTLDTFRV